MEILDVHGLVKSFGRRRVVDGVDLHVMQGEIVGLLGPNGAGKTTSFRMICGMLEPDAGSVFLSGQEVTTWPMYRRAKDGGMGYLAQESSVFRKLSVEQKPDGHAGTLGCAKKSSSATLSGIVGTVQHPASAQVEGVETIRRRTSPP